jgi:hypothetical protein
VGPKIAPEAMIAVVSPTFMSHAISIPMAMGSRLPTTAMRKPRIPTSLMVERSISMPASMTNKIRLLKGKEIEERERERKRIYIYIYIYINYESYEKIK